MKKNTATKSTLPILNAAFWRKSREARERVDAERRQQGHIAHLARQEREAAEQIELRAEAEKQGLKLNFYYKLIRCASCGEIKTASWRDGWCHDCCRKEYEAVTGRVL